MLFSGDDFLKAYCLFVLNLNEKMNIYDLKVVLDVVVVCPQLVVVLERESMLLFVDVDVHFKHVQ